MFHSNQKFCISCEEEHLEEIVRLILRMEGDKKRCKPLAYQIAGDRFAVGYYYDEPKPGWTKFMFGEKTGVELILAAIKQFAHDNPSHEYDGGDGSFHPGYLVEVVKQSFADEWEGIKNPWYGIFSVRAYNCYYSK